MRSRCNICQTHTFRKWKYVHAHLPSNPRKARFRSHHSLSSHATPVNATSPRGARDPSHCSEHTRSLRPTHCHNCPLMAKLSLAGHGLSLHSARGITGRGRLALGFFRTASEPRHRRAAAVTCVFRVPPMHPGAPPCRKGHRALEMHKLCSAQALRSPKLISVLFCFKHPFGTLRL